MPYIKESDYQSGLVKSLEKKFPGAIILKNDANYLQGFPDLLILYKNKWAALEVKRNSSASHRPNQDYYVDLLDGMSYASFIYPENEESVLNDLSRLFLP